MKHFLLFIALFFSISIAHAEEIKFDEAEVKSEFNEINKLESYVEKHEGTTYEDLKTDNSSLLENSNLKSTSATLVSNGLAANIPAFVWGFCLGMMGIALVYLMSDKDQALTKQALVGCFVRVGVIVAYYIYAVVVASRTASSYF